mmetsp:Transcript_26511/g.47908  ORF Transcript_26511/g.47908 Transcript_26511/m.47908 type:complete len:172 (+) Transcript_26511:524-1039(+)
MQKAIIDTRATSSLLRENLSSLDTYMATIKSNIEEFNEYVKQNYEGLLARGERCDDIMINLRCTHDSSSQQIRDAQETGCLECQVNRTRTDRRSISRTPEDQRCKSQALVRGTYGMGRSFAGEMRSQVTLKKKTRTPFRNDYSGHSACACSAVWDNYSSSLQAHHGRNLCS